MSEKRHLRRLPFVWQKQPVYFVTACVAQRRRLLATPASHAILLEEWSGLRDRHGWIVGRYVVMPDHVHFFATPHHSEGKPLHDVVGKWKEWTAKRILKLTGVSAPLWQPEFFDHLLRTEDSLAGNGPMCAIIPSAPDWLHTPKIGLTPDPWILHKSRTAICPEGSRAR